MTGFASRIGFGQVVHRRYRPQRHELRYRVFSLLVDLDDLPSIAASCRFLSHNRFNLLSLMEADHGDGAADGLRRTIADKVAAAGFPADIARVVMLCYPRVLGYVFNPLTVYYCLGACGRIVAMVYEVNNTFGGRHFYVLAADAPRNEVIHQSATKRFYVSPFNEVIGDYSFHVSPPGDRMSVGVALKVGGEPLMNAYQVLHTAALNDTNLLRAFCRMPLMTAKVIAGIHFEAARLWLKGLRTVPRPSPMPDHHPSNPPGALHRND